MKSKIVKLTLTSWFIFNYTCFVAKPITTPVPVEKRTIKSGTYFGLQSGRFYTIEYGWELQQKKQENLLRSNTFALHHGLSATYDFSRLNPVIGYDIGAWRRTGNFDFTYGISAAVRTDLHQLRFGVCPSLGIKVWQLHVQTGMYLLTPFYALNNNTFNSNTFFISARFLIVKHKNKKGDSPQPFFKS